MIDEMRRDAEIAKNLGFSCFELDHMQGKAPDRAFQIGEEDIDRCRDPILCSLWADDSERLGSFRNKLGVEQKKRYAAKMVTMEVAQENVIDACRINALLLHAKHDRCTAIEQDCLLTALEVKACLQASATTKSVTAAQYA